MLRKKGFNSSISGEIESFHEFVLKDEVKIEFVRSGGAGGQNVNKRSTKAQLHWSVDSSKLFSLAEKGKIKKSLASRINKEGELVLSRQDQRVQLQNKNQALSDLLKLLSKALEPIIPRIKTKKSMSVRRRELAKKIRRGKLKKQRQQKDFE